MSYQDKPEMHSGAAAIFCAIALCIGIVIAAWLQSITTSPHVILAWTLPMIFAGAAMLYLRDRYRIDFRF